MDWLIVYQQEQISTNKGVPHQQGLFVYLLLLFLQLFCSPSFEGLLLVCLLNKQVIVLLQQLFLHHLQRAFTIQICQHIKLSIHICKIFLLFVCTFYFQPIASNLNIKLIKQTVTTVTQIKLKKSVNITTITHFIAV